MITQYAEPKSLTVRQSFLNASSVLSLSPVVAMKEKFQKHKFFRSSGFNPLRPPSIACVIKAEASSSFYRFCMDLSGGNLMLILSRSKNESIIVNGNIRVVVLDIRGDKVQLGVEAPKDVPVFRSEVLKNSLWDLRAPCPEETSDILPISSEENAPDRT